MAAFLADFLVAMMGIRKWSVGRDYTSPIIVQREFAGRGIFVSEGDPSRSFCEGSLGFMKVFIGRTGSGDAVRIEWIYGIGCEGGLYRRLDRA